jgi:taurine dioxygenase
MKAQLAKLEIIPSGAPLGAEVRGIDLSRPIDGATLGIIERAYAEHGVLVFRDQHLTERQLVAVTEQFGEVEEYVRSTFAMPDHPEIILITNIEKDGEFVGVADAGTTWHTDMSYIPAPPRGSLLYAREVPVENGTVLGDTLFNSTAAAYDDLPEATKTLLEGRRTVHSYEGKHARRAKAGKSNRKPLTEEERAALAPVDHPVIRTHPQSGRKCIYVVAGECVGITGLPDDEAETLLENLADRCTRPEYTYRHHWQQHDLLMWDNCLVQHLAIHDYALPQRRMMWRTTIMGSVPA